MVPSSEIHVCQESFAGSGRFRRACSRNFLDWIRHFTCKRERVLLLWLVPSGRQTRGCGTKHSQGMIRKKADGAACLASHRKSSSSHLSGTSFFFFPPHVTKHRTRS